RRHERHPGKADDDRAHVGAGAGDPCQNASRQRPRSLADPGTGAGFYARFRRSRRAPAVRRQSQRRGHRWRTAANLQRTQGSHLGRCPLYAAGSCRQGRGDGMSEAGTTSQLAPAVRAPLGLLAELTHRCPLQCPYCSNPLALERARDELATEVWLDVLEQAAELGVLQLHLSGGEPTLRRDLEEMVALAAKLGFYSSLITAGVGLTRARLERLASLGLDHVQVSIQDAGAANADRIAHYVGGLARKLEVAGWVRTLGLPLTINAPVHRQ